MPQPAAPLSPTTIRLHWLVAWPMIAMLIFGLVLEDMPRGDQKTWLLGLHMGFGMLILLAAAWRFLWRLSEGPLEPVRVYAAHERILSRIVVLLLLVGTLTLPVSGMMMVLGNGKPIDMFGLFQIGPFGEAHLVHEAGHAIHNLGSKLVILGVILHVIGALKHHLIDRDTTLKRMLGRS